MDQMFSSSVPDTISIRKGTDGVAVHRFGWHKAIYENDQMVYIATVPGATKENMTIEVEDGVLQVNAQIQGDGYLIPENDVFESSAAVPARYDPTKAKATCMSGILKVIIPVKEKNNSEAVKIL